MYSPAQILKGVQRPELLFSEINCRYTHAKNGQEYNPEGCDVFEKDWDNLLILDACRYDAFKEIAAPALPGTLESRTSRGSTSPEFIRGNFSGKTLHDTVYVSANGWFAKLQDDINSEVHRFEFVDRDVMNGVTSKPETVAESIREMAEQYPNKRLIGHFMQPHHPFIGPSSGKFEYTRDIHEAKRLPRITREDLVQAYRENLELVLEHVKPLLDELEGRTVITADHGELLGERVRPIPVRRYGHPEGHYSTGLVKVPWHIYESGERKKIVSESPEQTDEVDFEAVKQNLVDLGYKV